MRSGSSWDSWVEERHLQGKVEEGVNEVVIEQVWLQAQVDQLGALGVVVVLLGLHARVGHALHLQRTACSVRLAISCPVSTVM